MRPMSALPDANANNITATSSSSNEANRIETRPADKEFSRASGDR
jgi:hypothetical protein